MPCYPCTHCNKCGIFSLQLEVTCKTCGAQVVVGKSICPECGTPYAGNTTRGKFGKAGGKADRYMEMAAEARKEMAEKRERAKRSRKKRA